jgi:hypothetical protein
VDEEPVAQRDAMKRASVFIPGWHKRKCWMRCFVRWLFSAWQLFYGKRSYWESITHQLWTFGLRTTHTVLVNLGLGGGIETGLGPTPKCKIYSYYYRQDSNYYILCPHRPHHLSSIE